LSETTPTRRAAAPPEILAELDPLTGLRNRHSMANDPERERARVLRTMPTRPSGRDATGCARGAGKFDCQPFGMGQNRK